MKYSKGKYNQFIYGTYFGQANYTAPAKVSTNFTAPTAISTNWDLELLHHYGYKAGTTTRGTYGEHLRYGGIAKVDYKFIGNTDYSTDS